MAKTRRIVTSMSLALLGTACAAVLDIQEAQLDESAAGGTSGTGGAGGAPARPTCAAYCAAAQKNCAGQFELYVSLETCMAVCATLPEGKLADTTGNTLGCRLHYAESAGTVGEKDVNCPAAGPGGDGVCGTNCEGLCTIALAVCRTDLLTEANCPGACTKLPDPGGYDDSISKGNSVQCRLYHASAATIDPGLHCAHAAGIGPCAP